MAKGQKGWCRMDDEVLGWLKGLIEDNNLHGFYTSPLWRKKQAQVLRESHYECQRCKSKGLVVRARTVHHKKYIKSHPELALDDGNLEAICDKCHYDEHHRKKPGFVNVERW